MLNIIRNPLYLLKLFLGLVFLSAGFYRIFNINLAVKEFSMFPIGLIYPLLTFTIILEITGGLLLILNKKIKLISAIFSAFIIIAVVSGIATSGGQIFSNISELFFFHANPTDIFLHLTYLIVLIYLFLISTKNKN